MARLDKEMIHKLSMLSRIQTTPEEEEGLLRDLSSIVNYFEQLNEVDTENVPPCNIVYTLNESVTREDMVKNTLPREKFLANAPDQIGGMVRVPPVLKRAN